MKFAKSVLILGVAICTLLCSSGVAVEKEEMTEAVVEILFKQPESIEAWEDDKVYLSPEKMYVAKDGVFLCNGHSLVKIPYFAIDHQGVFIICSKEDAQAHFDRAWESFRDAVGHSLASGTSFAFDQPVIGIYEGARAVEKFKEFGREYNAGLEIERNGTYDLPGDSRD